MKLIVRKFILYILFFQFNYLFSLNSDSLKRSVDTLSVNPKKFTNFIAVSSQFAATSTGYVIKYIGLNNFKTLKKTAWGLSLTFERLDFNNNLVVPSNVLILRVGYWAPGLNFIYRINNKFCFHAGMSCLLGAEEILSYYYEYTYSLWGIQTSPPKLKYKNESKSFYGFEIDPDIYFYPYKKSGVFFGLGLFVRSTTATVYNRDVGGRASVGFYF